jgi:predicted DCC family thiol-disulfide oxidoreductase YuxK
MSTEAAPDWEIEVFYDGACPLCRREIEMLRRWNKKDRLRFTDIAGAGFDPVKLGTTHEQLMAEIHGRLPDGTWVTGVEVFRRLYGAVGFRWLMPVTRLPGIRNLLNLGYRLFARNRLKLTGRCSADGTACSIGHRH